MEFLAAACVVAIAAIYAASCRRYAGFVKLADRKLYPAWFMLPVGLFLLDTFKRGCGTGYDRRLVSSIAELYGHKQAFTMLKIHHGNKIAMALLAFLFALLVGSSTKPDAGWLIFAIALPAAIFVFADRDLLERVKRRRTSIQMDFPDFVNKLILLVNAGLTILKAWERIACHEAKNTPLYLEARAVINDIGAGMPEQKAYEEFAKRCRVPAVTRFITVVLQNVRKGSNELVPILRMHADECWELRKSTAKKYGEEASARLLLPMMLMFLAVLLVVATPAMLALKNM